MDPNPRPGAAAGAPFLSVLVPAYNAERFLPEALSCVLGQPLQSLEVVIAEDGSSDSTLEICREWARRDSRVIIDSHPNLGLGANRNRALPLLRGEWTIFLDHDDLIAPGFLSNDLASFLHALGKAGVDVVVPARVVWEDGAADAAVEKVPDLGCVPGPEGSWSISHEFATLLYRTALIRENGLRFRESAPEVESVFRHQAVHCARRALFTNEFFFAVRRLSPGQITANWDFLSVGPVRVEAYAENVGWHRSRGDRAGAARARRELGRVAAGYALDAFARQGDSPAYLQLARQACLAGLARPWARHGFDRADARALAHRLDPAWMEGELARRREARASQPTSGSGAERASLAELYGRVAGFPEAYCRILGKLGE